MGGSVPAPVCGS